MFSSYHNSVERWHPNASKFGRSIAYVTAQEAMREGEELRDKIRGRRILEDTRVEA